MKLTFLIVHLLFALLSVGQKPTTIYNTKITKAEKVNIHVHNKYDTVIIKGNNNPVYLYVLNFESFNLDSLPNKEITRVTLGNPDSLPVHNVDFRIELSHPYDTVFIEIPTEPKKFNPFNTSSPIRGSKRNFSADKKTFNFIATYLAPNTKIELIIVADKHASKGHRIKIIGVDKLW